MVIKRQTDYVYFKIVRAIGTSFLLIFFQLRSFSTSNDIYSELISSTQHVIPSNPAVDEVVNAPGFPEQLDYDNQTAAKPGHGRPKKTSGSGQADNEKRKTDQEDVNKRVLRPPE